MHLLPLLALLPAALGHGLVRSPPARSPGDATTAACGRAMTTFYKSDNTSYPEALLRSNPTLGAKDGYDAAKCNLWLCKGYQFSDNAANVQAYTTGQTVPFDVWIRIPHRGHANVSVVDTTTNTVVGTPLVAWKENYAASAQPPADQTRFSVKIPELDGKCAVAGVCVGPLCLFLANHLGGHYLLA